MPSYLERYLAGEYETIWDELFAFGEELREGPHYDDALEVARETMRRVRHNIELLIPRLVRFGYRFGYDWLIQPLKDEPLDGLHHEWYLRDLQWVREQPPVFIPAAQRDEEYARLIELFGPDAPITKGYDYMFDNLPEFQMKDQVHELNELVGGLPLSILAWYEHVGGVNLIGYHPKWLQLFEKNSTYGSTLDPFFITPLDEERMSSFRKQQNKLNFLDLAPDRYFKHCISGGGPYFVHIPSKAADAIFHWEYEDIVQEETTFVQYLRLCFKWAGFPGLARLEHPPLEDIARLTQGFQKF